MSVVQFVDKERLEGQKALEALVRHYKGFMRMPLENPFDSTKEAWVWGSHTWRLLGRFIKRERLAEVTGTRGEIPPSFVVPTDSLEVIQALLLHARIAQDKSKSVLSAYLAALLALDSVLRQRNKQLSAVTVYDLNGTVEKYGIESTRGLGPVIEFLGALKIVKSQSVLQWINPVRDQVSKDEYKKNKVLGLENAAYKLPNYEAVMAVCKYFKNQPWLTRGDSYDELDEDFKNVIVGNFLSIVLMVPCRLQDIEQLSENCLVSKKDGDVVVWGMDWFSSKTDMDHIKWIPYTPSGEFVNVVREALERIKIVTEPARQVFKTWDSECDEYIPRAFMEAKAKGWLPKNWPYLSKDNNVRYSDALFVELKYQSNSKRHTVENVAKAIPKDQIRAWLVSRWSVNAHTKEKNVYTPSFFERIGFGDFKFSLDDYNTHSFRHLVNTAARLGGMSEYDVNWWSHRREMGEVYDHRTSEQRMNLIATGDYQSRELSPEERLERINNQIPMTRKNLGLKFEIVTNASGGFTLQHPLGTCTHNYSESPCQKNVNCLECEENAYCKGDKRTLKNLKEALDEVNRKIEMATSESDDFSLRRLQIKHELVSALVEILGDESPLEDGALVMLNQENIVDSGLVSRAKALADQIQHGTNLISIKHSDAIRQLGIVRALPLISSSQDKEFIKNELLLDEFMLGFEEDDE